MEKGVFIAVGVFILVLLFGFTVLRIAKISTQKKTKLKKIFWCAYALFFIGNGGNYIYEFPINPMGYLYVIFGIATFWFNYKSTLVNHMHL